MSSQALFLGALLGVILGLLYFGGLWLTVRRLPKVKRPRFFLLLSSLFRLSLVLGCFWLIMRQDLVLFLITLLFFFLLRIVLIGLARKPARREMHAN
ncbi:MAG: hypothetical protein M8357_09835 [Desulfobulbaceae bacterium]|nr:hypothetical protein [Desulfobulbaceae bacterium]